MATQNFKVEFDYQRDGELKHALWFVAGAKDEKDAVRRATEGKKAVNVKVEQE